MLNIIKEKLDLSPDLKKKINWASKYTSTSITLEKGNLIRLEPTNLAYVDSHKVIINDIKFLFFNGVDCFYINSLNISFIYVLLIQKHCLGCNAYQKNGKTCIQKANVSEILEKIVQADNFFVILFDNYSFTFAMFLIIFFT